MTASGNRGGGQRHKGDRVFVGTRLLRPRRDLLVALAKAESITVTDLLARILENEFSNRDFINLDIEHDSPGGQTVPRN